MKINRPPVVNIDSFGIFSGTARIRIEDEAKDPFYDSGAGVSAIPWPVASNGHLSEGTEEDFRASFH
jgi:hypothetical protein